jgi:hypothetical protein
LGNGERGRKEIDKEGKGMRGWEETDKVGTRREEMERDR